MEDETNTVRAKFSKSAKEIMCVTNEIHDALDSLIQEYLKNKSSTIPDSVQSIRAKLCNINNINMQNLYGVPQGFLMSNLEGEA